MRRFAYLGDHREVILYGVTFPAGEAVAVDPQEHPVLVKKLEGNSHFAEQFDGFSMHGDVIEGAVSDAVEPETSAIVETKEPKRRGRPPKVK